MIAGKNIWDQKLNLLTPTLSQKELQLTRRITWPKLFQVVLLMFMVIKIYQLTKELKHNSASSYHIANITGHLLQCIEIDRRALYGA